MKRSYFQYLKDPSVSVPYTTAYNRITRNKNELPRDQLQVCKITLFYHFY